VPRGRRTENGNETAALPGLPDEITRPGGSLLAIHSCRPKISWIPPRLVRLGETYDRLESVAEGPPPRPFVFHLRRLEAGDPGRTVLVYEGPELAQR